MLNNICMCATLSDFLLKSLLCAYRRNEDYLVQKKERFNGGTCHGPSSHLAMIMIKDYGIYKTH